MIPGMNAAEPIERLNDAVPSEASTFAEPRAVGVPAYSLGRPSGHPLRHKRALLVLALSALLVDACALWPIGIGDGGSNTLNFENHTTEFVQVVYLPKVGREFVLIKTWISPGESASSVEGLGCTAGTLVARNEAGEDVDRREEPLCQGETWRIGDPEPTTSG